MTATFGSGDYDGVTSESLVIRRDRERAVLERRFSTHRRGPGQVEEWGPFSGAEADRVVRSLGYLLDQPWLLNDEVEIEKQYWAAEKAQEGKKEKSESLSEKIVGRESYGAPYYPGVEFELRDGVGNLWWNADPHDWYGANPERFNSIRQPVDSTVFPFLAKRYPESKRREGGKESGWRAKRVEKPKL